MNAITIEEEIQAKGLTAERVTREQIEAEIAGEYSFTGAQAVGPDTPLFPAMHLLTICVLVLRNRYTVVGTSACVSPENFDADVGRRVARENAIDQVWPLLGFRLRDRLAHDQFPIASGIEERARRAHEVNRAYCISQGDDSQVPWDEAPQWQRDSAIEGVKLAILGQTPEQLHESWCDHKRADGWVYGPTKDAVALTHPCLVPYDQLPAEQRVKDHLFRAAVLG